MNVLEVVRRECCASGRAPTDKRAALREVARLAAAIGALGTLTENDIEKGLAEREKVGTTGFGRGIAIPHCRLEGTEEFVVGVVSVPDGVDFDAIDGEQVRLLVFIV